MSCPFRWMRRRWFKGRPMRLSSSSRTGASIIDSGPEKWSSRSDLYSRRGPGPRQTPLDRRRPRSARGPRGRDRLEARRSRERPRPPARPARPGVHDGHDHARPPVQEGRAAPAQGGPRVPLFRADHSPGAGAVCRSASDGLAARSDARVRAAAAVGPGGHARADRRSPPGRARADDPREARPAPPRGPMTYLMLGACFCLAGFLAADLAVTGWIAAAWALVGDGARRWSPSQRRRLLAAARVLPCAAALLFATLVVAPGYVWREPRGARESVGPMLALAALAAIAL